MPSIEELQKQLAEQIAGLAAQRKEEADKAEKEARLREAEAQIERQKNIDAYKARQEELHRKKHEAELEIEAKRRDLARQQSEVDNAKNAAQAAREQQGRLLDDLKAKIANAEFAEEQHRKHIESIKAARPTITVEENSINVEHPELEVNGGNAVAGTDGLEEGPTMSQHLKHILRQAQRQ